LGTGILTLVSILVANTQSPAAKTKAANPAKPVASALLSAPIPVEQWLAAPTAALEPGEIDRLVDRELALGKIKPAPLTTDAQFIRRVTLDLTGRLPMPADVTEFIADRSSGKRAKLVDKLLASDEFAEHWARFWRDVVSARVTDLRGQILVRHFEIWMAEQLKKNKNWGDITRAIITAEGDLRAEEPGKNGAVFFLGARFGADAAVDRAAETSRVFLGIQIQCAQCHDHPSDVWKRHQFHELAAYFARTQTRPIRGGGAGFGVRLFSRPRGEYQMPARNDPKRRTIVQPRYLTGEAPGIRLTDMERRRALAESIVNPKNPWFAGAYVNRVWGELLGQSFYLPVDDLGPQKDAYLPRVLVRLAGAFRGSNYDMKALIRAILSSRTYQRQIRLGESAEEHLLFAGSYPARLRADTIWQSLVDVLGRLGNPPPNRNGRFAIFRGFESVFQQEFRFDPSLKPDEVEHSIPQALMMMNNPVINGRIQARGTNLLARILRAYPKNDDAIRMVYLRTFARRPTDRELTRCRQYLQKVGNRAEAFEDILWALLNSTEFQTKR
jgi:hypothetical protein